MTSLFPRQKRSNLAWGLADLPEIQRAQVLLDQLRQFQQKPKLSGTVIAELTMWRAMLGEDEYGPELGITAIAWAQTLPVLAQFVSDVSWKGLLADLIKLATDATALSPAEEPLTHQLFAVELPLTLAYLFPELPECRALEVPARKLLAWGAEEATDGEGLLRGRHLSLTLPLLASWARVVTLLAAMPSGVDEDIRAQFAWLWRQALRLRREDGSLVFTSVGEQTDFAEITTVALQQIDDAANHRLARLALRGAPVGRGSKSKGNKPAAPEPFEYSEWSAVGILRRSWQRGSPRLTVSFDDRRFECELDAEGLVLLTGTWNTEVVIDGWTWRTENDWEEVCWHTDEDICYLEVETKLTEGWRLQRQLLVASQQQIVLVADAVLGEEPAQLEYRCTRPLEEAIRFLPADETREGYLAARRAQALVLPLALPEWRTETGRGELSATGDGLTLTQTTRGRRMFAPLLFDLSSNRIRKECTWRQLTVAEQLKIVSPEVAVAYRAQVGKDQWAIYRSLGPKANRTFLGQNLVNEYFVGVFKPDGTTATLLEVE